ncbi:sialic acid-binding Ig-like lectin 13 [Podarcis raffonei]|uniref:sialic acid-binding Ig-like lectin 13 n=1 Tax=Podarcis raffonei TaxID=65483 RepID=UPI0023298F7D|nr:sialic acid-binding Ig-like lectin 13 [Podarcis raffonei]
MSYLLGAFIFGLLSTCLHWEGAHCLPGYNLTVPPEVRVQEGFCVVIPCKFTYPASTDTSGVELHGYWYTVGSRTYNELVATNDGNKYIAHFTRNRFLLSGNLEQGDCSLTINDTRKSSDERGYYFRVEKGTIKFSYSDLPTLVKVAEKPEIQIPGKLRAGHPVNISCSTPGSCSSQVDLTWGGVSVANTSRATSEQTNEIKVYSTFIPSIADHGQNLICNASYNQGTHPVQTEERIQLDVSYPPMLWFSGILERPGESRRNFTDASHIEVQEGDSITLFCRIKSNPSANAAWVTKSQKTAGWQSSGTNILPISNVKLADKGGYKCRASNTEGETDATFQLYVAYSPRPCEQNNSRCWKDGNGFQCNCSICSYPASTIQWQVNGKNLEGNYTDETMKVTSWNKTEEVTSTLHLTGDLDGEQHIVCLGTNPGGQIPLKFFVASSGDSLKRNLISGVMGALVMLAVVMLIVIIVVLISRRYPKDRKPLTASESIAKPLTHVHNELSPDVKRNSLTVPNPDEGKDAPEDQEKFDEFPDQMSNDPEELHYASLNFGELKCLPEPTSEESKSDYAEIKKV